MTLRKKAQSGIPNSILEALKEYPGKVGNPSADLSYSITES